MRYFVVGDTHGRHDDEPIAAFDQVHGHTPHRDGPRVYHQPSGAFTINLDVGASAGWAEKGDPRAKRIVGLWLDADGQPPSWEVAEETFVEYVE